MPEDFSFAYHNAAHPDMIYDGYLEGDEKIVLHRLHPDCETLRFFLPGYRVGLLVRYMSGAMAAAKIELDTLCVETEENRAYLVWRGQFDESEKTRVVEARMTVPARGRKETAIG